MNQVLILVDQQDEEEEEGAGASTLQKRAGYTDRFSFDNEMAFTEQLTAFMKEAWIPDEEVEGEEPPEEIPEDLVKEITIEGTQEELFNRICTSIDPFYPKVNEDGTVRA